MNIRDYLRSNKKLISITVLINVFLMLIILGGVAAVIELNQGAIFNRFAQDYEHEQRTLDVATSSRYLPQESQVVDIVERTNPAVVSIVVTKDVPIYERRFQRFGPFRVPELREQGTREREIGSGSGFFVSGDGMVVTNKHVVSQADASYTVVTKNGEKFAADVIARDDIVDIAVLKVTDNVENIPYLKFGDSDSLKLGQTVVAIGNALAEFRNTVSVGVISGLSRSIVAGSGISGQQELLEGVIQTDAAINPGNSGGPLLDLSGNVIGVNVAVAQGSENIGFALPSNMVDHIVQSVKEHGEILRPYLGVRYIPVNSHIREENNLSVDYGAYLHGEGAVAPESPADEAGLQQGDVIISIDGISLREQSLVSAIRAQKIGEEITVTFVRDGEERRVTVTLVEMPTN